MNRLIEDFTQSLYKGFIDKDVSHQGNFTPKLLINNKKKMFYQLYKNYKSAHLLVYQWLLLLKVV